MKIKFCCDNGASIHSQRTETIDTEKCFRLTGDEWNALTEDERDEYVHEWAIEKYSYWWEAA